MKFGVEVQGDDPPAPVDFRMIPTLLAPPSGEKNRHLAFLVRTFSPKGLGGFL